MAEQQAQGISLRLGLIVLAVWVLITFGLESVQTGFRARSLEDAFAASIFWPGLVAVAVVTAVVLQQRAAGAVGVGRPRRLRVLALPGLLLVLSALIASGSGTVSWLLFANFMIVGLNEELMFRGVLFSGAVSRWGARLGIIFTSVLFGAVHLLNVIFVGNTFSGSVVQALLAMIGGFWLAVLRYLCGSIWPVVILHGLYDFAVAGAGPILLLVEGLLAGYALILFITLVPKRAASDPAPG